MLPQLAGLTKRLLHGRIHLRFVVEVKPQSGVNLRQRKVGVLEMNFLRTPTVRDHVLRHFDNLGVRVINPSDAARVEPDVSGLNRRWCRHTPGNYRAIPRQTRLQLLKIVAAMAVTGFGRTPNFISTLK